MRLSWILLILVLCVPLHAQEKSIGFGKRVRIASASFDGVGIVVGQSPSDLTLAVENRAEPVVTPWTSISRLEVRRTLSTAEGALKGAKWGLGIGGGLALFVALTTGATVPADEASVAEFAIMAVAEGIVIGAIIGALRPGGRWERVRERPRLTLGSPGAGQGIAVRVPL